MARPSKTSANRGVAYINGVRRTLFAVWVETGYVLHLSNHGRPGVNLTVMGLDAGPYRSIRSIRKDLDFHLV